MAHDPALAARFREALGALPGVSEKRMMGGLVFLLHGNMVGGTDVTRAGERRLMFRVGKPNIPAAEALGGGEEMVMAGGRMPGFYFVADSRCDDAALAQWVTLARRHAESLPAK